MKNRIVVPFAWFLLWVSNAACAQPSADGGFDVHNLTGIWVLEQPQEAGRTLSPNRPAMTALGKQIFDTVRSSRGDQPWSNQHSPADQSEWNDPVDWCDPFGYPRAWWEPQSRVMRFVQTPDDLIQMWEWHRNWRDIWIDGRPLHEDPEPRYYGYAVGGWEGDTMVVESNGFTDRTWLDPYGSPHSADMRLRETFRRVSHDKMEWTLTVIDPSIYTEPWTTGVRMLTLVDKPPRSPYEELREDICVWSDQAIFYEGVDTTGQGVLPALPPQIREALLDQ